MSFPPVTSITALRRSRHGFRIGYRSASLAFVAALFGCLSLSWRLSPSGVPLRFAGDAAFGVTLSVVVLLFAGLALRIARRAEAGSIGARTGLLRGALTALARESEVATGLVASLIAGAAVASSPAACEGVAGWFAPALGLSTSGCATATVTIIAAIGTVTSELARRGIARSLERV